MTWAQIVTSRVIEWFGLARSAAVDRT